MSLIEQLQKKFSTIKTPFNKWISQPSYIDQLNKYLKGIDITEKKLWYSALSDYALLYPTEIKIKNLHSKLQKLCLDEADEMTEMTEITDKIVDKPTPAIKKKSITVKNKIINEIKESNEVIHKIISDDKIITSSQSKIIAFIDKVHKDLYTAESLEGESALNDIMNLLFIKAVAPILSDIPMTGYIDLFNKSYYADRYDDDELDEIFSYFKDMKLIIKMDDGLKDESDIRDLTQSNDIIRQMGDILCLHPITNKIFTEKNFLKAKQPSTVINLIKAIIKLNIDDLYHNEDTIGIIYEHIINNYLRSGAKLGQYFTPRLMMKQLLSYKKDKFDEIIKYNISTSEKTKILDTCMGTGGWLVSFYNMHRDADLLLSGNDVKSSTFQYGIMNLLLTLHHFPHEMIRDNSLTHVNNNKHHIILTNPPFQTDNDFKQVSSSFSKDKFTAENNIKIDDVYKICSNNPPIQFLEMNTFKLAENGVCIIILPYGDLFFGKKYKEARAYFINNINITDIIIFPAGIFTHTSIKTAALIYENNGRTKEINFIESSNNCTILTKIFTILYDILSSHANISWYYSDYTKQNICKTVKEDTVLMKLGNAAIFKNGKGLKKSDIIPGEFPVIGGGKKPVGFHNGYNRNENVILCSSSGSAGYISKYKCKIWASDCFSIEPDVTIIGNDYLYYLLKLMFQEAIYTMQMGAAQPHVYSYQLADFVIPVPSIAKQKEIVAYIDDVYENITLLNQTINRLHLNNDMYVTKILSDVILVKLDSVCKIKPGTYIKKIDKVDGIYPVYGGGDISYYINQYNRKNEIIIAKDGMSLNCVRYVSDKFFLNHHGWTLDCYDIIIKKYLFYYLQTIQEKLYSLSHGAAQLGINQDNFYNVYIPLPSLDMQSEIVAHLDLYASYVDITNQLIKEKELNITTYLNSVI